MHSVILFDGVCNLCNSFVQFVIKHDKKERFMFASLQSDFAQKTLVNSFVASQKLSTVVLLEDRKTYSKSTAALRVLKKLNGLWPLLYVFIILPTFIRDAVYNLIAKNRYKWFGKKDSCMMPSPELRRRFLS
ncbi:thiol-disulfide oxidoreductase DCC [Pseudopedobacter saltans DSM 12145]|uniref:Thiol-disulfide oxidoreductase DCC n=1 Tax=Pseudopedobacter saltans (strain ATCC 51119 / DSM 12145 / JCM 21818 / CCUG 39354 / LMG 10337 / NBRC 100064 / NCIMB 13643) TaxID=762903 RepID=F0S8H3_PSESL|nr:DCC1-like thiol-disulfide oxidoreductase family protein [Pseudopedobacter saltans]ADY53437.1 thiol-disulfide oxidoreductase DCC [Pseudopedobacter saltans DSM 12145]